MLSIIIITKNEADNLPRLLENIKAQEFPDYEILVSDAQSTDNTRQIAKSAGCKIIEGGLPSFGRNEGARHAAGEILLFLDADVLLPAGFIKSCLQEFSARSLDVAGVYVKPDTKSITLKIFHHILNFYMRASQHLFPHMPGFCIFAKKNIHERINGFDNTILLSEDSDYVNRAHKIAKFRMLNSARVICSVRRLEKEGYFILALKYAFIPLYRAIFGEIRTDIFRYRFDHYKEK